MLEKTWQINERYYYYYNHYHKYYYDTITVALRTLLTGNLMGKNGRGFKLVRF